MHMVNSSPSDSPIEKHEAELLALLNELKQFDKVHRLESRFNFFEAVGIVRQETKHSRFLAFLLDPKASHGLGEQFLRRFISGLIENHPAPGVSLLKVATSDLHDAKVICERDHFDISVELPSLGLLLVVENKIDAAESEDQLTGYRDLATNRYGGLKFLGCFLTRDGYQGQDESWGLMSYAMVANELRSILSENTVAQDVEMAIRQYVHLIEKEIIVTDELIEACRKIYLNHKTAIDLIIEHGVESPVNQAFDEFFDTHKELTSLSIRSTTAYFVSKNWPISHWDLKAVKKYGWRFDTPILLWFDLSKPKKLVLYVEVGPVQDSDIDRRSLLIKSLRENLKIATPSKGGGTTFTRIMKYSISLPEEPTHAELLSAFQSVFDKLNHDGVMGIVEKTMLGLPALAPASIDTAEPSIQKVQLP